MRCELVDVLFLEKRLKGPIFIKLKPKPLNFFALFSNLEELLKNLAYLHQHVVSL